MSIQNVYINLKSHWFYAIMFFFVFVAIGIIVYFSIKPIDEKFDNTTPPTPITERMPTNNSSSQILLPVSQGSSFINPPFTYSFSDPLPTTLPVFAKSVPAYTPQELKTLSTRFEMSTDLKEIADGIYWSSEGGESFLSLDPKSGFVNYDNSALPPKPDSENPTRIITQDTQILPAALELLNKYGAPRDNTDLKNPTIRYIVNYSEDPLFTESFNDANYFLVSFPRAINNVKLYKQFGETIDTTVIFDRLHAVKRLSYYDLAIS